MNIIKSNTKPNTKNIYINPHLYDIPTLTGMQQWILIEKEPTNSNISWKWYDLKWCIFQLNIIRMYKQLEYFEQYQRRVTALFGAQQTQQLVNGALTLITVGGNDFVNNYYLVPFSARSRQFRLPDYVRYLISEYRKILMVTFFYITSHVSVSSMQICPSSPSTRDLAAIDINLSIKILEHFYTISHQLILFYCIF
jgi:hypothetical protein